MKVEKLVLGVGVLIFGVGVISGFAGEDGSLFRVTKRVTERAISGARNRAGGQHSLGMIGGMSEGVAKEIHHQLRNELKQGKISKEQYKSEFRKRLKLKMRQIAEQRAKMGLTGKGKGLKSVMMNKSIMQKLRKRIQERMKAKHKHSGSPIAPMAKERAMKMQQIMTNKMFRRKRSFLQMLNPMYAVRAVNNTLKNKLGGAMDRCSGRRCAAKAESAE